MASSPTPRRRVETKVTEELCALLSRKVKNIGDAEVLIKAGKGPSLCRDLSRPGLEGPLTDADPNREGALVPVARPVNPKSAKQRRPRIGGRILPEGPAGPAGKHPANGFFCGHRPSAAIPSFRSVTVQTRCLAFYPMYKVWPNCGHDHFQGRKPSPNNSAILAEFDNYDYFFIHYKYTDMYGEDGNFEARKRH